jgi:hypothetical protein
MKSAEWQKFLRRFSCKFILFLSVSSLAVVFNVRAGLPPYIDDLNDMIGYRPSDFSPVKIRDEKIEKAIDNLGFMPLRAVSKKHFELKYPGLAGRTNPYGQRQTDIDFRYTLTDDYTYFKYPLRKGLVLCLFEISANDTLGDFKKKQELFSDVRILQESEAPEEDLKWIALGYKINQNGKNIFDAIPGKPLTARFDESDLVATLFYKESVLFIVNIRFSTWARNGSDQALLGYEFSRRVMEFKKCHWIRVTEIDSGSGTVITEALKPVIVDLAKAAAAAAIK